MSGNVIDYANRDTPRQRAVSREAIALLAIAGGLSVASFAVVLVGANEEPYYGPVQRSQMLIQVGGGCVLLFAWLQWLAAAAYLAHRRRIHPLLTGASIVWFAIIAYYLHFSPWGYADDVARSQKPAVFVQQTTTPSP